MMAIFLQEKIREEDQKNFFIKLISDIHTRKIIQVTQVKPISALEIYQKYNIPKSSLNKRLRDLRKLNLVKVSGLVNDDGKKYCFIKVE